MTGLEFPHIGEDGAHVIPIQDFQHAACEKCAEAKGELRWQPKEGMTFEVSFPGVSRLDLNRFYQSAASAGGAGSLQEMSAEAEWEAKTADGMLVKLYGTYPDVTHRMTTKNRLSEQEATVFGKVAYGYVQLHRDNELSFWHETTSDQRLFFAGVTVDKWPELAKVEIEQGETTCTRWRGFLQLLDIPRLTLVSSLQKVAGEECGWLVSDLVPPAGDKWFSSECDAVRNLLSFLICKWVPFLWRDIFVDSSSLERIYYGWQRVPVKRSHALAPVPLGGTIESLKYGLDVCKAMPDMLSRLLGVNADYDVAWIMSPIWTAVNSFADDKLALACVSLERLAQAHEDLSQKQAKSSGIAQQKRLSQETEDEIRKALLKCLGAEAERLKLDAELRTVLQRKIENIGLAQPPSSNKLVKVFTDLDIALTDKERAAIKTRHKSLHGARTLHANRETTDLADELQRFDTLVTVVQKAVLILLGYRGPYVDYGERPASGNFPIKQM